MAQRQITSFFKKIDKESADSARHDSKVDSSAEGKRKRDESPNNEAPPPKKAINGKKTPAKSKPKTPKKKTADKLTGKKKNPSGAKGKKNAKTTKVTKEAPKVDDKKDEIQKESPKADKSPSKVVEESDESEIEADKPAIKAKTYSRIVSKVDSSDEEEQKASSESPKKTKAEESDDEEAGDVKTNGHNGKSPSKDERKSSESEKDSDDEVSPKKKKSKSKSTSPDEEKSSGKADKSKAKRKSTFITEEDFEAKGKSPTKAKETSKRTLASSDNDEDDADYSEKEEKPTTQNKKKKSKRRSIDDDGDSEEDEKKSPAKAKRAKPKSKSPPPVEEDSDEKSPAKSKKAKRKSKSPPPVEEDSDEKSPAKSKKAKPKSKSPSPVDDDSEEKSEEKSGVKVHPFFKSKEGKKEQGKNVSEEKNSDDTKYYPNKDTYHPILDAYWKKDEKVPYIALTRTLELIESTSSRLKMVEILSNYFRSVMILSPDDLLPSIYMCLNQLAPAYEGIESGIADTSLIKVIGQCTGRTPTQIKAHLEKVGDLGIIAEESRLNQKLMFQPAPLTVSKVFDKLKEIALMTGTSSTAKKIDKIQSLYVACRFTEARYLIRSLAGKLRIGLAEQSVLQALALACAKTPPCQDYPPEMINAAKKCSADQFKKKYDEIALIIKTTYCECPSYDKIVPVILNEGVNALPEKCRLTPGIPLKPMLAHPTKGVQEVLKRFDNLKFTCEWKYDGERAQIHVDSNGKVTIYSRNQENNTSKYPDIIGRFENTKGDNVKNCILDCEAIAWDPEKKQILPFQILSTRKRKDANESEIKVPVCVFMFDLLYFNDEPLVKEPFIKRRQLLRDNFKEVEGEWSFATNLDATTMEQVQEFLEVSVKGNCEGLMVKTLEQEATYEIAKRSHNWLKLKKDYLEGVGDTLDIVVIGGYTGKGKRTGTYGGFLLACYDPENEEYQSICKLGTGFSDEDLQTHTTSLKESVIPKPKSYYRYDSSHEPDHWFEPTQVWEVKCADLSLSPAHTAAFGIVDSAKGISLRFPRFIRIRTDKKPEEATSSQQVADLYKNQEQIANQKSSNTVDDEDFY